MVRTADRGAEPTPRQVRSLFAFLTFVALACFWRKVPETRGRSLQETERDLVPVQSLRTPG